MNGEAERPRDRNGRFIAAANDNGAGGGGRGSRGREPRRAGAGALKWTREREATFFRELAMVCNVRAALRKAKLPGCSSLAYERRKADARFRAAWDEAIDQSYAMLELEMLERSRFGDDRPPPATEAERRLREIPTALAMQLLKLYQNRARIRAAAPAAARGEAPLTRARGEALRREIERMLSDFNRRMGGNG